MKYLLVIALVLVVFWLWRKQRETDRRAASHEAGQARPHASPPQGREVMDMVACDVCQVHLPRSEALIGSTGIYCSDAHRRKAGAG